MRGWFGPSRTRWTLSYLLALVFSESRSVEVSKEGLAGFGWCVGCQKSSNFGSPSFVHFTTSTYSNMTSQLLKGAQDLAFHRQSQCDSSHDQFHVLRVLKLSTLICLNHERTPDLLVVQLSALFHDLLDRKYLPKELEGVSAHDYLAEFWAHWTERDVTTSQRRLVEDIISNVSYSKEVKRIKNREQTAFHETCIELHWWVFFPCDDALFLHRLTRLCLPVFRTQTN